MIYLALYKGHRNGHWYAPRVALARLSDWLIRQVTHGKYSHCEIAIAKENGVYSCYSSSIRDGGVRFKVMPLPPDKWDLIRVDLPEQRVHEFYAQTKGAKYDWAGCLGIALPALRQNVKKWFYSKWCAAVLDLKQPARFSPNGLAKQLSGSLK
ncbi:hypothetical protein [Kingella kingae]|uniref:Uncharacterized protein n=2 Tax=Kingella kingae TaxID=504 RepID=F5S6C5_KINKI|nr:hypothetical protein [Kingella kingae]EGK10387.1 hypothetical protein HMPREF0476_0758 [Kingella kingae ATCC 23330]UOP03947.1 hypothetical protein LVJ79_05250 [Kingella kingae]SQH25188.1 Uncharacterised protein [Kingella kingae]